MSTIFTKIIEGEIPSYKVAENDQFLAFLDIQPIVKGHVLVIPKKEIDYIFDIEDDLLGEFMSFAKSVAKQMDKVFDRSEEHTSELQSRPHLVCRLLLEKKNSLN